MAGYRVIEAGDTDRALDLVASGSPDLVLSAADLPDGGCRRLLEAVQKRPANARIPVIALAGGAD